MRIFLHSGKRSLRCEKDHHPFYRKTRENTNAVIISRSDRRAKRFAYVGIYANGAFYNFRRTETFSRTHTDIGRIRVPRFSPIIGKEIFEILFPTGFRTFIDKNRYVWYNLHTKLHIAYRMFKRKPFGVNNFRCSEYAERIKFSGE